VKKRIIISSLFLLIISSFISNLHSAGAIFVYDNGKWELFAPASQICAINHVDGIQKMVIGVSLGRKFEGEKIAWIFPVPAIAEDIKISETIEFPHLHGVIVEDRAEDLISFTFARFRAMQIYYGFLESLLLTDMHIIDLSLPVNEFNFSEYMKLFERSGDIITTTVMSSQAQKEFNNLILSDNPELLDEFEGIMKDYIREDYSFVFTIIEDVEKLIERKADERYKNLRKCIRGDLLGISISFPNEKIYYPQKISGIYSDRAIPARIYIMDFVEPEISTDSFYFMNYAKVEYFVASKHIWSWIFNLDLVDFFSDQDPTDDLRYTRINIFASSVSYYRDIWMSTKVPSNIKRQYFIIRIARWYGLFCFILSSCIASLFAWRITFRAKSFNWKNFLFGLFNIFTIVGFSLVTYLTRTKKLPSEIREILFSKWLNESGYLSKKHLVALLISLLVLVLFVLFGKQHLYSYMYSEVCDVILFVGIALGIILVSLHLSTRTAKKNGFSCTITDFKKLLFLLGFNIFLIIVGQILYDTQLEKIEKIATIIGYTYKTDYGNGISLYYNFAYLFSIFKFTLSILLLIPVNVLFAKKFPTRGIYIIPKDNRKIWFVMLFSITFVILTYIFQFALKVLL